MNGKRPRLRLLIGGSIIAGLTAITITGSFIFASGSALSGQRARITESWQEYKVAAHARSNSSYSRMVVYLTDRLTTDPEKTDLLDLFSKRLVVVNEFTDLSHIDTDPELQESWLQAQFDLTQVLEKLFETFKRSTAIKPADNELFNFLLNLQGAVLQAHNNLFDSVFDFNLEAESWGWLWGIEMYPAPLPLYHRLYRR
jgi:hypothetical protein